MEEGFPVRFHHIHLLACEALGSNFMNLRFLICTMGTVIVPPS